ncbi:disease resistance protein [Trifolium pratense]|uniref:Disease resistance protein n=1 Tax=Trifolium pratense TaxID=57577 RepID=A0A2K3LHR2_TRIPR|nr:disease resistance protein [Trifolium pratense]
MSSLHTLECTGLLHLTSLQKLRIEECPKLENMEGERLPASLIQLEIVGCPLLEERCRMKHPQIWPKISHIKGAAKGVVLIWMTVHTAKIPPRDLIGIENEAMTVAVLRDDMLKDN